MRGVRAGTRVRRIDTRTLRRRRRRGETCVMLTLYLPGFALLPPGHAASALGLSGREVVRLFLWFLPPLLLLLLLRSQLRRGAPSSDRRNPHDPRALSQLSCATTAPARLPVAESPPVTKALLLNYKYLPPPHLSLSCKRYSVTGRASAVSAGTSLSDTQ